MEDFVSFRWSMANRNPIDALNGSKGSIDQMQASVHIENGKSVVVYKKNMRERGGFQSFEEMMTELNKDLKAEKQ